MAHYGWAGPGKMQELEFDRVKPPELVEPTSVAMPGEATETVWCCTLCDKKFRKSMILARHFNTNHTDHKTDKDSWREYAKEGTE